MPASVFNKEYFATNTYNGVSFGKYSQYWFSNRFYAILAKRYGKIGGTLLEEGCGLGHLLSQLGGAFKTYGVDVNTWALTQVKGTAPQAMLSYATAEQLPFKDGSFNIILSKHVVEHLENPYNAISEISRLLAKGGILILATPNLSSLLKPMKGKQWIGYQDPTHISLKTPEEWRSLLEHGGMKIIKIFSDGFWDVPYVKYIPSKIQKFLFGSLGGLQALTGMIFLPPRWGESIIFIAQKE